MKSPPQRRFFWPGSHGQLPAARDALLKSRIKNRGKPTKSSQLALNSRWHYLTASIYIYIYFVIMWWHLFTSDLCTFLLKSTSTCNTKAPPMLHPDPHPTPNSDVCPPNLSKFARSPRPSQDSNSLHRKTTIDRCWMMVTPDPCKPSSTTANINIRKNIYSTIVT